MVIDCVPNEKIFEMRVQFDMIRRKFIQLYVLCKYFVWRSYLGNLRSGIIPSSEHGACELKLLTDIILYA